MSRKVTHICYADESNWNNGKFRSICALSMSIEKVELFEKALEARLMESNVTELKWKKIDSAKYRLAAEKAMKLTLEYAVKNEIRVDTVIWDTTDSRHNVFGRDDVANLERMYFHLIRNILTKRWPDDLLWLLHPDEHNQIDWNTLQDVLSHKSVMQSNTDSLFNSIHIQENFLYRIEKVEPAKSHEKILVQVSDVFAGMAWFSKEHNAEYTRWQNQKSNQGELFSSEIDFNPTNTQRERFPLIELLDIYCLKHSLGPSFISGKGLITKDPSKPINFWWYQPQTEKDKAPVKNIF